MQHLYKQCLLEKNNKQQIAWLPTVYCKTGKALKLRESTQAGCLEKLSDWDDGWVIKTVYKETLAENQLDLTANQYRYTRTVSDI